MNEPKLRFKADGEKPFPDWEKRKFSDVFDNINNSTFSRDCLNYVDGNVKYIHYGDILTTFDSTVNAEASNVPYVNKDINCEKYQLLADGDIIVADTAEDDTVGKSVEITNTSNVKLISGLHTIACRPKLKFASGYLGHYMNSNPYHNQLRPYMQGIKVTSISKANIVLTNVSIPSLPEQQKIASLFTELDDLIQSAEKELEGYRELKQGMLQKMFPKKGEKVPEIRFPEFTGDWEQHRFGELYSKVSEKNDLSFGADKIISVANMYFKEEVKESSDKYMRTYNVMRLGDIAFEGNKSKNYSHGRFVENTIGDGIVSHVFDVFRPTTSYDLLFWKYLINNEGVMGRIMARCTNASTMMTNLVASDFLKEKILVPSLKEQKKIGTYFDNLDHLITLHQREIDGYKELKKGLLQQMFC